MSQSHSTRHIQDDNQQAALSVPDGSLQPGQMLQNRYRILGIIGMGGMGAVYQARDMKFPKVQRLVAVKEMINMAKDQTLREQTMLNFEREAEILATLDHPMIPKIFDFFGFGDRAYLVQEYIQGKDLEAILNSTDQFLPVEQVRQWGVQICDVLSYLHNHKPEPIVFRDMKPSNIMVDHLKNIRLIDFGIAKTFQMGQPGTMIGTEGYSPPEQYKGVASPASDIYALGASLHHLLTRRDPRLEPPFSFDQKPMQHFNPNIPDSLSAVVMRALSYSPDERYSTAEAMKQSLEASGATQTGIATTPQPAADASVAPQAGLVPAPPVGSQQIVYVVADGSLIPGLTPEQRPGSTGAPHAIDRSVPESVKALWSFKVEDAVRSTPLFDKNVVYVGAYDNNLWALNANDGSLKWNFATNGGIGASPIYNNGIIYIGSTDQKMYAIDARTGKLKWTFATEGKIYSTACFSHGTLFFGSDDGKFYAVKPGPASGREAWHFSAIAPIRSSPLLDEVSEFVTFGTNSGDFICLDLSGDVQWRFSSRREIISTPLLNGNMLYFGSNDMHLYAVDITNGYRVWAFRTRGPIISSPAYGSGKIFFGSADGHLYAINPQNGREVWKKSVGDKITSSPAVFREALYIGCSDGNVYSFHVETGDILWRFQTDGPVLSSPTVSEELGMVFIGSDDKHVYALNA